MTTYHSKEALKSIRRQQKLIFSQTLGQRIRQARKEQGMPLATLGKRLAVTYQQVRKYEIGENSVSVYDLCKIAVFLKKPVEWFLQKD